MKKFICAILAVGCTIAILGAAGASDLDKMGCAKSFSICAIALPILIVSMKIGGFENEK